MSRSHESLVTSSPVECRPLHHNSPVSQKMANNRKMGLERLNKMVSEGVLPGSTTGVLKTIICDKFAKYANINENSRKLERIELLKKLAMYRTVLDGIFRRHGFSMKVLQLPEHQQLSNEIARMAAAILELSRPVSDAEFVEEMRFAVATNDIKPEPEDTIVIEDGDESTEPTTNKPEQTRIPRTSVYPIILSTESLIAGSSENPIVGPSVSQAVHSSEKAIVPASTLTEIIGLPNFRPILPFLAPKLARLPEHYVNAYFEGKRLILQRNSSIKIINRVGRPKKLFGSCKKPQKCTK